MSKEYKHLAHRISNLEKAVHKLEAACTPREEHVASNPHENNTEDKNVATVPESLVPSFGPRPNDTSTSKEKWYKSLGQGIWRFRTLEGIGIVSVTIYAWLTYRQWQDTRRNFAASERAWIEITTKIPDILTENDSISSVPVTIRNIGKSPALHVIANGVFKIVRSPEQPRFDFSAPHSGYASGIIFPNRDNREFNISFYGDGRIRSLSRDEIRSLIRGDAYLIAFVQLAYEDQFGSHWTRFCGWKPYSVGRSYLAGDCTQWNAVGDGKQPK